eukprot:symbB.v1.2.019832.t1/scaffold1644.1/size164340/2
MPHHCRQDGHRRKRDSATEVGLVEAHKTTHGGDQGRASTTRVRTKLMGSLRISGKISAQQALHLAEAFLDVGVLDTRYHAKEFGQSEQRRCRSSNVFETVVEDTPTRSSRASSSTRTRSLVHAFCNLRTWFWDYSLSSHLDLKMLNTCRLSGQRWRRSISVGAGVGGTTASGAQKFAEVPLGMTWSISNRTIGSTRKKRCNLYSIVAFGHFISPKSEIRSCRWPLVQAKLHIGFSMSQWRLRH